MMVSLIMPLITPTKNIATVILVFKVEPEKQQALIDVGINNSQKVMEKKPGFISSSFHKSFDGKSVVNYAQWENRKSYDEAINFLNPEEVKLEKKSLNLETLTGISMS